MTIIFFITIRYNCVLGHPTPLSKFYHNPFRHHSTPRVRSQTDTQKVLL